MCGFSGFFSLKSYPSEVYTSYLKKMTDVIAHRGPDGEGFWVDESIGIALGHRRLSIIDLKESGHQPMHSMSGRYVIVYNGEVYNYLEIKSELDQVIQTSWKGHSDTEVILRAFEHWGIKVALEKFCGMFAFAVWDKQEKKLILARDRIGEKPLYYGWIGDFFIFGSELKIIKALDNVTPPLDLHAISAYFRYGYIPSPHTIFQGVRKLLPGTYLEIDNSVLQSKEEELTPANYWEAKQWFTAEHLHNFSINNAQKKLEEILLKVIEQQLISDVPIGAFLSGGIDSSLIVSLMQKVSTTKVKTFTIGFDQSEFNEAEYALAVAKHLRTEHTELYMTQQDIFDVIPKLPDIYDEPFADSSQIPTFLISSLTRSKVTVALSGDGGDELFAGYTRYLTTKKLLNFKKILPSPMSSIIGNAVLSIPQFNLNQDTVLKKIGVSRVWDLTRKTAQVLRMPKEQVYEYIIALWKLNEEVVLNSSKLSILQDVHQLENKDDFTKMMYIDIMTYLPDDIMVKVDRAAMAVGLETRAPFLDRRVVEFASTLPLSMKLKGKTSKSILKSLVYKYVPQPLLDRPKQGFGVPLADWLRGPLKDWANDLLSSNMLMQHDYLDCDLIRKKWAIHLSGKENLQYQLWAVLMFQSWYNRHMQ